MKLIVIGAGASGLAAAVTAARNGADVVVLQSAAKPGKKLLATGNGRCNLMNTGKPLYFGDRKLAETVLAACPGTVQGFLESTGLVLAQEEGGRVYPASGQAAGVLQALMYAAQIAGVRFVYEKKAEHIVKARNGLIVRCADEELRADRVILCCGGRAGIRLGHDGSAYRLLTELGHTLIAPRPALAGIETEKSAVSGLSGLRCPVRLSLCVKDRIVQASAGEVLFADYGISGVCAMQLSDTAGRLLEQHPVIYADFAPMLFEHLRSYTHTQELFEAVDASYDRIRALLEERMEKLGRDGLLIGLLPMLLKNKLKDCSVGRLAEMLSMYPLKVRGVRGFEHAQVTAGGLDTKEFSSRTLESRLVPGVYACGEVLNVHGDCGGFNLQFAFACGILAGTCAAGA